MCEVKKKIVLWLDDMRNPYEIQWLNVINLITKDIPTQIVWVKNYNEFVHYIDNHEIPDIICFDHDLGEYGENEKNGLSCCRYIVDKCINDNCDIPRYYVQSSNAAGRENIISLMENWHNFWIKNKRGE